MTGKDRVLAAAQMLTDQTVSNGSDRPFFVTFLNGVAYGAALADIGDQPKAMDEFVMAAQLETFFEDNFQSKGIK